MPSRVFKFYQRKRIVNINVNILAAGFVSIAIAKYPVYLIGEWIGTEHKFLITVIAYLLDMTIDVMVYYALHWIANHWNPRGHLPKDEARPKSRKFLHDATRIQAERAALVPLFMLVSMGGMWALQHFYQVAHSWAFVFAFAAAMIITRIAHTLWGYQSGTFKDHVDFVLDDDIQIGHDLMAESESEPNPEQDERVAS